MLDNLRFLKTPKNKKFNFQPRYWDEEKEEFERRVKAARGEAENDFDREAVRSRISFREHSRAKRPNSAATLRTIIIAVFLCIVLYFLYLYI